MLLNQDYTDLGNGAVLQSTKLIKRFLHMR